MSPSDPRSTAALLAESAWLHRLALRLVAEPAGAADAAQETLARALERPPRATLPLRRWLAAVLRNVVRQERRTGKRRVAREHARAQPSNSQPTDELAARLELHGTLLEAVRALAEPYRTTVALRFLEDLPVSAVAERMGVPEKTVYTRLERALGQLRERLDRAHRGREAWAGLLLPFLSPGLSTSPPTELAGPAALTPLLAMGTLWKWTGACAALATLGLLATRTLPSRGARDAATLPPPDQSPMAELERPERLSLESAEIPAERAAVEALAPPAARAEEATPPALATRFGFVRDLERNPIAGLEITFEPLKATPSHAAASEALVGPTRSDAQGRFPLPLDTTCRLVARGRGYATVIAPTLAGPPPPEPPIVYVAPERSYAGQVLDGAGLSVAEAELGIYPARELVRALTPGTLLGGFPLAEGSSDTAGRFDFPSVGGAPGSHLSAWAPGFKTTKLELPPDSSGALVVVLEPAAEVERALAGVVEFPDGSPASGAYVSSGGGAVRSDGDGAFEIALDPEDQPERVWAVLVGHLPAELGLAGTPESAWRGLMLTLGSEALAIRGQVVDGEGRPMEGVQVWTDDGERFGEIARELGEVSFQLTYDIEGVIAGAEIDPRHGRKARADAEGRFELTGLLPRRYGLYVLDPRTCELAGPFEVAAGADAFVLTLPGEPTQRVAGRLLSYSGTPVVDANINLARARRGSDGRLRVHRSDPSRAIRTDAEGRFSFEALCIEGTQLVVASPDAPIELTFELAAQPDIEHLELAFPATCHVRVHLDEPERAESLTLNDADDQPLDLTFQIGGVLCSCQSVQITDGISDLLTTDERARTLVLWKDNAVSERIPLRLVSGEVNDVRP